ncbi:MAG TPA: PAS domain S-box protein [Pyrinomonadaceae bacterium]|nr:PAS domain S-box protein [Pyrinomonadaceae bacterium]
MATSKSKKQNGRQATGALRESEELFRTMADTAPVMIWMADASGSRNFFNKGWLDFRGRTPDEEADAGWQEGVHPEDLARFLELYNEAFAARRPYTTEYRLRRRDGAYRWILANGVPRHSPAGEFVGFIGTCIDIDDRKRAELERARLASEIEAERRRLRDIVGSVPGVVWEAWGEPDEAAQRINFVSDYAEQLLGYTVEEWLAEPNFWLKLVHPEDRERAAREARAKFESREGGVSEFRWLTKDGRVVFAEAHSGPVFDERGRPAGMRGVTMDITGRRRAEEALRASEELSQAVLNSLQAHIAVLDREGRIVAVNEAWRRFSAENGGAGARTDVGADYLRVCDAAAGGGGDGASEIVEGVRAVLEGRSESFRAEYPCHSPGEERWFTLYATPLPGGRGGAVVSHILITDRKRAEEQLERRARQATLGADVGRALAESGTTLRRTLQRCAESVVEQLDAAFARIWTYNPGERVLELQASAGMYTHLDGPHGRVPLGRFKIGLIAEERRPHLTNSVVGDPHVGDQEWARREGMVSFAGYPLVVEDRLVGVLAMFARRPLPDDTLEALASVSNVIAQGVERKRADEALKEYARERERMFEEVSTPVVPVLEGVLVLPLIGSLDTTRMERATKAALQEVARTGARAIIIDITGARVVDSHAVANLGNLVASLRLVGADAVVTGVSAHAAQSLVGLGLDLQGLRTHRTLAQALASLIRGGARHGKANWK